MDTPPPSPYKHKAPPPPNTFTNPIKPSRLPSRTPPPKPRKPIDPHSHRLRRSGRLQDAILALEQGPPIKPRAYISLLQSCIDSGSVDLGRRIHASVDAVDGADPSVGTKLVSMYAKCGSLDDARRVFDEMRERNLFAWSAMIGACVREQRWEEVVELFVRMVGEGALPDPFLLTRISQACANTGDLVIGMLLHSLAVRLGFIDFLEGNHLVNSVLAMYSKCGELSCAKRFFEKMVVKDVVSWNSIISGCCQRGERKEALRLFKLMRMEGVEPGLVTWNILITSYTKSGDLSVAMELMKEMESCGIVPDVFTWTSLISGFAQHNRVNEALDLFQKMWLLGVEPNGITVSSAISACASLKSSGHGRELHSYAVKTGGVNAVLVGNSLVDMYAKCGRLEEARRVFEQMQEKDVFSWNSMIGGYTQAGYCGEAFELFSKMERSGVRRNVVTWNAMISGYIQNGVDDQAMELFQRMEIEGVKRNTASWNTLIAGSVHSGNLDEALRIFRQMQSASMRPNSVTILSILPACTNIMSAWKVREIHACILHYELRNSTSVANALIDTYAKSGNMASAKAVFDGLKSRDHISWNSIIGACVMHGHSHTAQNLFFEMKKEGTKENRAILASMIYAYGLEGNVNQAKDLLSNMEIEYQLTPSLEHYTAMVDLYGRSGRLREASDLVENMPIAPDFAFWDAFFTAARIYGNIRLANLAAENLFKLEPKNPRIHRLLSQMQALCGKSYNLSVVRKPTKDRKLDDSYGCSWADIRNKVYCFFNGVSVDRESKYNEFKAIIDDFKPALSDLGDSRLDFEEEKEEVSGIHSEKLAIASGIINSPKFRRIRIMKSVRVCTHCHTFAKLISKQYNREILIKDPKCSHHFKDGKCSCRDYW